MDPLVLKKETSTLLELMNISPKSIDIIHDNDLHLVIISIRLSGDIAEQFTDRNNAIARDFGMILKQLLQKKHHYFKDITLDINGTGIKFIQETKQKAAIALERVQFFDKPYEFGFLNAYERMLIHNYLKNIPEIITESTGEGKERRLQIRKKQN